MQVLFVAYSLQFFEIMILNSWRSRNIVELFTNFIAMTFKQTIIKIFSNRLVQHILFWSFFLGMEVSHFIERIDDVEAHLFFGKFLIRMGGAAIVVYLNLRVLIPFLLNKGKSLTYFISVIGTILIVSYPGSFIISEYFPSQMRLNHANKPWFTEIPYLVSIIVTVFLTTTTSLLHLAKEWVKLKDVKIELEEVARQKLEAELKALKAQINPHFLFNTLNNIYSLSLDKSDRAPETILKLSDLMSYMIYESSDDTVEIKNEIEFLKNYIALEQIRVSDDININVKFDDNLMGIKVAPLLFIPFIENAFKHCPKSGSQKPYIKISMHAFNNTLEFNMRNTREEEAQYTDIKHSGIGIENVRKRLNLIYPQKHELEIHENANEFSVKLRLEI